MDILEVSKRSFESRRLTSKAFLNKVSSTVGIIVHDDIQLSQFLITKEGTLKLNDFNRAETMLYSDEEQVYCRYKNGAGHGNFRAPEEYVDNPLNEKIDVWSFGNIVYALLTGLWPFPDTDGDDMKAFKVRSYAQCGYVVHFPVHCLLIDFFHTRLATNRPWTYTY
jgi:serine/threonine protein kinase